MTFEYLYRAWKSRRVTQAVAAKLLGVSDRTFRRYVHRFESSGPEGLIDKRGLRRSPRRAPLDEVADVVNAYNKQHEGWNVKQFYSRYRDTGGRRSYNWVRLQLQDAGAVKRLPRRGVHGTRFDRAPLPGLRLHQDSSRDDWLAGRRCDLVVTLDDATGEHYSISLWERAGTRSSLAGVRVVLERKGFFCSLYTDRGSHYWHTPEAGGKVDKANPTQFGRAMARLGVEMVPACSPEARGRSERMFGTHQDRLVKELALEGITEMAEANRHIREACLPRFNAEFARPAREDGSAFVPMGGPAALDDILCEVHERTVGRDNCVRFDRLTLRIEPDGARPHYVKAKVKVRRHMDGSLSVWHGPRLLRRYEADGAPRPKPLAEAA